LSLYESKTVVLFESAAGMWHVGQLCDNVPPPPFERRTLQPSMSLLFELVRSGSTNLNPQNSVTIDNLLLLVGGAKDRFLNGDAIRDLLALATRDVDGIECFESLAIDTSTERGQEILSAAVERMSTKCEKNRATRLFVPWNNRSSHWTLLCLDLNDQTARYVDSLSTDGRSRRVPSEVRQFCKLFFGQSWRGSIDSLPSPQQPDAYNCGVYVVLNAWHLARNRTLPTEYPSGAELRVQLAKCWLYDQSLEL
jgi:hypothetical protein